MRAKLLLTAAIAIGGILSFQAKKPLDHNSFDNWKSLKIAPLSTNGDWAAYMANAQEGDGYLVFYNTKTGRQVRIERGYSPAFSADSKYAVAMIKPLFADTRKAKIDKKKDFDLPQDSLAIIDLKTGSVEKIANVISYKLGEKGGNTLAYQSCDTSLVKPKDLKDKKLGRPLVVRPLAKPSDKVISWVKDYSFTKDGSKLAFSLLPSEKDTVATKAVGVVLPSDTSYTLLSFDKKHYGAPVWNNAGTQLAYTASNDTIDESGTRRMDLFLVDVTESEPFIKSIPVHHYERDSGLNLALPHSDDPVRQEQLMEEYRKAMKAARGEELFVNQYATPKFSDNDRKLIIGVAPFRAANDTTIVDFEKATLDIWRWDAPFTPPQENHLVDKIKKNQFPVVINLDNGMQVLTLTDLLGDVLPAGRWDADWVLIEDPSENYTSRQWDYAAPKTLKVKNTRTGETKVVGQVPRDEGEISPDGKYVVWFDKDRNYHSYDIATGKSAVISDKVPYPLWNEEQDVPIYRMAYGKTYWTAGDKGIIVSDRHDLWLLDPKGVAEPVCLTNGDGRKNNRRYSYLKTDKEQLAIPDGQLMLLDVFDYGDKRQGLATLPNNGKPANPTVKVLDTYEFWNVNKAKDADVYAFRKSNFETSPDCWVVRGTDFAKAKKISDINPQMKDYSWGKAQLVKWHAYNGQLTEGVLYTPDDFDPSGSYPMMVVFYETGSEHLYHHYQMEPSWSWVNYPFYVSRGYVVFQPDVHYAPGIPGESAYNYICSGVEEVCRQYPQIDKNRIGIDGQSWGGYQTAYLVTRTDMFACAGSGAPVSNMTSAFGGIRWESGDSRMPQYEQGQSRIGRNLWEAPELYITNSPLFYADRVTTPLLIMHNDNDGAVPWYQGIELFMALRRLGKPVWMLTYNGEAHNIRERRNRKDITIRLQQFFDHYLKGDPMPKWMKEGIPAVRKGQEWNTELIED